MHLLTKDFLLEIIPFIRPQIRNLQLLWNINVFLKGKHVRRSAKCLKYTRTSPRRVFLGVIKICSLALSYDFCSNDMRILEVQNQKTPSEVIHVWWCQYLLPCELRRLPVEVYFDFVYSQNEGSMFCSLSWSFLFLTSQTDSPSLCLFISGIL